MKTVTLCMRVLLLGLFLGLSQFARSDTVVVYNQYFKVGGDADSACQASGHCVTLIPQYSVYGWYYESSYEPALTILITYYWFPSPVCPSVDIFIATASGPGGYCVDAEGISASNEYDQSSTQAFNNCNKKSFCTSYTSSINGQVVFISGEMLSGTLIAAKNYWYPATPCQSYQIYSAPPSGSGPGVCVGNPPPTISFSFAPSAVFAGETATLTWSSTNTTGCTASGAWSGSQPTSGSMVVGPLTSDSKFYLNCTGAGGSAAAEVDIALRLDENYGAPACAVGNPCDPASGNKYLERVDYQVPNTGLTFARYYNSGSISYARSLGAGWSHSYDASLEIPWSSPGPPLCLQNAQAGAPPNEVQARRADGKVLPFSCPVPVTNTPLQNCTARGNYHATLVENPCNFVLTLSDGSSEQYNLGGLLISSTDTAGRITNYSYLQQNGVNLINKVTGPFGHTLTVGRNTANVVSSITDLTGITIVYNYIGVNTSWVLNGFNYQDNSGEGYIYHDPANPYTLTNVWTVDTNGIPTPYAHYGYYSNSGNPSDPNNGKAILTEHAVTNNTYSQEKFTLAYDTPAAGQTTVTSAPDSPTGKVTEVMTFATNLGVKNLVSKTSSIDTKWLQQVFDGNNNLLCRKDEENRVTLYGYNPSNQKTSMTEGLSGTDCNACLANPGSCNAAGIARTTNYQYLSATLDLPTVITSPSVDPGQSKTTTIRYGNTISGDTCNGQPPYLPCQVTVSGFTRAGAQVSRTVTFGYNGYGEVTSIIGPRTDLVEQTQLAYFSCATGGDCGQLSSTTNALGQVTTYDRYDAGGRLLQMTDPNGVVTTYGYDVRGQVKTITQTPPATSPAIPQNSFVPLVATTGPSASNADADADNDNDEDADHWWSRWRTRHHHHEHRHPGNTDASVATTSVAPAAQPQISTALSPLLSTGPATWQYSYTPWGDIAQVTDPDGVVLYYGYDAAHYLRTISDNANPSAGNSLRYSYDLKSNRTVDAAYDATGTLAHTVSYSFDLRNHLQSLTEGNNLNVTQLAYDAVGNLSTQSPNSDGVNRTMQYQYDALNRLYNIVDAVNGPNAPTRYAYYPNDRPQQVTAPNNLSTQYQYDDLGNLLSETSPDRGSTIYSYDAAGNMLTRTDARGQVTTYTYDALNRVASKQSSAAFTKPAFSSYDSCYRGRLCSISDGAMPAMTFGYDNLGRMNYSRDGYSGLASQFTWSAGGRLASITDPSGRTTNYTYDFQNAGTPIMGQVVQVSTTYNGTTTVLANNITYHPFGPVAAFSFGNGLTYTAQFDTAYRPTARTDGVYAETITNYDGADNILVRTIPGSQGFTYDALSRLATATDNSSGGFGTLAYAYDLNGNRQSETRNGTATNYVYSPSGSNWLSQAGTESRVPNPDGSTASATSLGSLSYDGYGDLTGATTASGAYAYDPFGRRNAKRTGGAWTSFAYGPHSELLYESNGTNTRSYVYLNGAPVARIDNNSQIYYYHDDHLGSPQAMTDASGATVWKAYYEPFGKATVTTQTVINNLRLPGQYFDSETGLYYNGARYYDPKIGRYISSDPIGLAGGLNTYLYGRANPLRYTDPSGEDPLVIIGAVIGGVSGAIQAANSGGGWTSANALNILLATGSGATIGALAGLTPTEWGPLAALVTGAAAGGGGNLAGQATTWAINKHNNPGSCSAFNPDWQAAGTQALLGSSAALLGFYSGFGYALNAVNGGSSSAAALGAGNLLNATTSGAATVIGNDFISTTNGGFLPP